VLFTFDCTVVCCSNLSVGVNCIFCGGWLLWQSYWIIATRLVYIYTDITLCTFVQLLAASVSSIKLQEAFEKYWAHSPLRAATRRLF